MFKKLIVSLSVVGLLCVSPIFFCSAISPIGETNYKGLDLYNGDTENGQVNWPDLAKNQDFVWLKSSEGNDWIDHVYQENAKNAESVGVKYGFYHFFKIHDIASSKYQADFFYNLIKDYKFSVIPALDVEVTDGYEKDYISACTDAFIDEFYKDAGYYPIVYTYWDFANRFLVDSKEVSKCKLWFAYYNSDIESKTVPEWNNYVAWQYSSVGELSYVANHYVDQNVATSDIFMDSVNIGTPIQTVPSQSTQTVSQSYPTVRYGDNSESVVTLQSKLNKFGYGLVVDGNFGNLTLKSVKDFQTKHGLEIDGIAGKQTFIALDTVQVQASNSEYSSAVLSVQQKLNRLHITDENGNSLSVDGVSGNCTLSAIKKFQTICGIDSDGVWGNITESCYTQIMSKPYLKQGDNGLAVRYLQYRIGCEFDGQFGGVTARYLSNYQWSHGLYGDSICGELTWSSFLN